MNKFVHYDKNASALELARALTQAKKERLKYIYELKFIYGQELLVLHDLIQRKVKEIEYMSVRARQIREDDEINEPTQGSIN